VQVFTVICDMKSFLLKRMTVIVSHIGRNIVYCDMKSFLLKRMTVIVSHIRQIIKCSWSHFY
jgi:hypothetical protein